jgi:type I restriction enzyme S subunit
MTRLPQGWVAISLEELGMARTPSIDPSLFPNERFELFSVPSYSNLAPEQPLGSEIGSTKQTVEPGDVMVCKIVPHINRVWVVPPRGPFRQIASSEWIVIRNAQTEPKFLRWLMSAPDFRNEFLKDLSGIGGSLTRARPQTVAKIEIPLPPLPEQRRIVRKLDTLSARSSTARTHLTAIEKLVERYRTAVLEAEFRKAWDAGCDTTIAGCLEHAATGLVRSKAEQTPDEGYPYIRMNHYDLAGRWNDRDLTYVAASSPEFQRYQLRANDLLFNTRNSAELVGKVAIWPEGKDGYLFNNNLLRMRFSADVVPAFAFWQMSSPPFRGYIEGFISATTSVAAIYQRSLMAAPFWMPDTDEQRKIVGRIETAFAKIDRLKAEAVKALKLLGHLDQRILAKAFTGELIPQDPNDEPAESLLARIRVERDRHQKTGRGRRTRS